MARVTQKTIARHLGLSPSLVSRALNGRAAEIGVLPETIERIERAARELGYVPNDAARQLRGAGNKVLGVVAADLADPFFGPLLSTLIRVSHGHGYALALAGLDSRSANTGDVGLLLEQPLTGLIVAGSGPIPWTAPFLRRGIPVARIGSGIAPRGCRQVAPDTADGMDRLMRHLAALGHRRIAFAGADIGIHRERGRLAITAARTHGMILPADHTVYGEAEVMCAGEEAVDTLLRRVNRSRPTAIVCSSDAVAFGVLGRLAARGIRIPHDVSVTGFDDLPMARLTIPPLTTMRQPLRAMTEAALRIIERPDTTDNISDFMTAKLVIRSSTATPGRTPP